MIGVGLLTAAAGAKPPWKTADSVPSAAYGGAVKINYGMVRQSEIDRCLACPLPVCTNCAGKERGQRW